MIPSLTGFSLLIEASACDGLDSECPLESTGMWTQSGSHSIYNDYNSSEFPASNWAINSTEPLRLEGSAVSSRVRVTLQGEGRNNEFFDDLAFTIASNLTSTFAGTGAYTMNVGMFSLYPGLENMNWESVNGSQVSVPNILSRAYQSGSIPSSSYGLHVGSVEPPVPGSLVLGGYDRSRCITSPIISGSNTFTLTDISLEVTAGGSAFVDTPEYPTSGLLMNNDNQSVSSMTVFPNPAVPYLYLPADTCNAIAKFLPVSFDGDLELYLWNVSDPAFRKIVSSPSALKFSFDSASGTSDIFVPFALLNLTLDYPLASTPTQYFPCSPYTPSTDSTYHLGRAFLQAAFLGQNGNTQRVFLAQAPGPGTQAEDIIRLASTDTELTAMVNPQLWNDTWSSVLEALPADVPTNSTTTFAIDESEGLGGGAIAGIVIGVIAGVAIAGVIAFFVIRRRRKSQVVWGGRQNDAVEKESGPTEANVSEAASQGLYEVASDAAEHKGSTKPPAEMDVPAYVGELEGSYAYQRH